jgi:GTPase SAR1 family protein
MNFELKVLLLNSECKPDISQYFRSKTTQDFKKIIGVNIYNQEIFVDEKSIVLNIWDLASPSKLYEHARSKFFHGTKILMIFIDLADPQSIELSKTYVEEFDSNIQEKIPKILVGVCNSADSRLRSINYSMAKQFADTHDMMYTERTDKLELIMLAIGMMGLNKPLPAEMQAIFSEKQSDTVDLISHFMHHDSNEIEQGMKDFEQDWNSIWKQVKNEEEMLSQQRIQNLKSNFKYLISKSSSLKPILGPIFNPNKENYEIYVSILKSWAENKPGKLENLRSFLQDQHNSQQKYWKNIYNLKLDLLTQKEKFLQEVKGEIEKLIEETLESKQQLKNDLDTEEIPHQIKVNITQIDQLINKIINKET